MSTCSTNTSGNGYVGRSGTSRYLPRTSFLDAQLAYESLKIIDIDQAITNLDTALKNYNKITCVPNTSPKTYPGSPLIFFPGQDKRDDLETIIVKDDKKFPRPGDMPRGYMHFFGSNVPPNTTLKSYYFSKYKNSNDDVIYISLSNPVTRTDQPVYYLMTNSNTFNDTSNDTCIPTAEDLDVKKVAVEAAFTPIADYYSNITSLNTTLQNYISKAATNIVESDSKLTSEERYTNRIHPENTMRARESMMPELRITTLPYLLAISVFMASLSIFLIFQINGFSGQLNIPASLSSLLSSPASGSIPFYENPMVLGGLLIICLVIAIIFGVLYFHSKNTNRE